ncbi:MAG: HD-GYP domain-containing protein, partial [bacterium]
IIKKHTTNGAQILANSNNEIIKTAEIIALYHHEKYDGSGYPFGIKGEEIPIEGRIVAIADVFDSITSRRPYREPKTIEEAIYEIKRSVNFHFCPEVVNAFFKSIKKIIEVRHALV